MDNRNIKFITKTVAAIWIGLLLILSACGAQPVETSTAASTLPLTDSPTPTLPPPTPIPRPVTPSPTQLTAHPDGRDYAFDGSISRKVLENYLSRSIAMRGLF